MVRLSQLYMTTGQTIALTVLTFVSEVMFLFFYLARFIIALWLQSLSAVILEPKKIKSVTASSFSPSVCHEVMGPDPMVLVFEC